MASILPVTSSDLEKKLEALGDRYNFNTPIRDLWNADECPEELLIYLAWALSVDNWNDDWPIEIKRKVVKSSLDIHRLKGTSKSLSDAVDALGYGVTIEYWHQNPLIEKGKFKVNIKARDVPVTEAAYNEISEVINENKRGTLHLDSFSIATTTVANLKCFSHLKIGEHIRVLVRAEGPVKSTGTLYSGFTAVVRERITVQTRD